MQIFIRTPTSSLPFSIDSTSTTSSLCSNITQTTGLTDFHLSYQGKELSVLPPSTPLTSFLERDANVWLSLRLPGGGPKKRCAYRLTATEQCSSQAMRLVGECSHCSATFCGRHRLPEDHNCSGLDGAKENAWKENKEKLEKEATGSGKMVL